LYMGNAGGPGPGGPGPGGPGTAPLHQSKQGSRCMPAPSSAGLT
jgi:hypothetical protein